jgi:ABC-2 type transport system permease protein
VKAFNRLVIASFKQFLRDKTSLFFTFAFPIVFMVLFGLVFSGNDKTIYDIGLVDQDNSVSSNNIKVALKAMPVFRLTEGNLDNKLDQMKKGKIDALIIIPAEFESNISQGNQVGLTAYFDPSQQSSQIILALVRQVADQTNQQISRIPSIISIREESISAYNLKYVDYIIPGILAMSILFLGLFGSLPMVEWREKQVLKRLGATPLPRTTLVSSQVFYRVLLALVQTAMIILVARFVFKVNMVGNWFLLAGIVILGSLTFVAIGYLAVARPRTTEGAIPLIQLVQFPMLFLSGIFFPLDTMPAFMKPIVAIMPLTYLGDALRQVMTGAAPDNALLVNLIVLLGWFVISTVLAIRFFRWE